ncbi:MAG: F0F1 ATP synthase subunit B [Actinomycetota bacterium]
MFYVFAAEGPNGVHIPSDVNEVYWGSAAFLVLVVLFFRFGLKPARAAMRGRTERIAAELAEARQAREEAEAALTASTADLPDVSSEEERIRTEAVEQAARLKADLIAKAESDAEDIRTRGTAEVDNYRRQAIADLTNQMSSLTKDSAEALVTESLDDRSHADLIENYINQVQQL